MLFGHRVCVIWQIERGWQLFWDGDVALGQLGQKRVWSDPSGLQVAPDQSVAVVHLLHTPVHTTHLTFRQVSLAVLFV